MGKLPVIGKVKKKVCPVFNVPERNTPVMFPGVPLVTVCGVESKFFHITVAPRSTTGLGGTKALFVITIESEAVMVGDGLGTGVDGTRVGMLGGYCTVFGYGIMSFCPG